MNDYTWYSQPFRADGGITADGLLGQLGRPNLSRLTLLVREAAQNSWDARRDNENVVGFRLDLSTVGAAHIAAWRSLFSAGVLRSGDIDDAFRGLSQAASIRYLAVSDRGTNGLGGPTRSDAGQSSRREWLRFVLNSGDRDGDQSQGASGGTFGYGKGAFFLNSKVGCILVYTRFREGVGVRSRFIGAAIRKSFWHGNVRYTGRHWWGVKEEDHCQPVEGDAADAVARSLGLPSFSEDETGTTVIIVDPDLTDPALPDDGSADEMTVNDAGAYLADAAAWNLWPILLHERPIRMTATVTANGVEIKVPGPDDDAALAFFANAYRKAVGHEGEVLKCGRPQKDLGDFAFDYTYAASITAPAARELGLEGAPHHVCLLRGPELVTRYYSGPARPNPHLGYTGVFKVSEELDPAFARSEPPTHDSWNYQQLKGHEATFVRTAGRRLKERCDEISGATAKKAFKVGDYAMGSVANRLGFLLAGPGGTGAAILDIAPGPGTAFDPRGNDLTAQAVQSGAADISSESAGGSGEESGASFDVSPLGPPMPRTKATRHPTLVSSPRYEMLDGKPVLVQIVRIHGSGRNEASVKVVTGDGGIEGASPTGATIPTVHGWRTAGSKLVPGEVLYHSEGLAEVELIVNAVPDAVIDISVRGQV